MSTINEHNPLLPTPELALAFEARVTLDPAQELGSIDGMSRRIIPITGGTVFGPRLSGVVLPGGADWQTIQSDELARIHARYTLRTDEGHLISVVNPGIRHGPPDVMKRLAGGEPVDPSLYYFRTSPTFEVGATELSWLTRSIFICVGARFASAVHIRFYELL